MSKFDSVRSWVDGKHPYTLKSERKENPVKKTKPEKAQISDEEKLDKYSRLYVSLCVVVCAVVLLFLLITAEGMPPFGNEANATNNEVPRRYVAMAEEETGAENSIAGMILNYRGFDTFGESCVLFLAVCCVMILVWDPEGRNTKDILPEPPHDSILSVCASMIIPCAFCFGICTLMNGHVSPGGGFSGGSILGASLILFATAQGKETVHRFFTERTFNVVRITGLMIYACMFGVYIYQGANTGESELARYIVLVIDVAVGLVVMSTMYGFYSFFEKGKV